MNRGLHLNAMRLLLHIFIAALTAPTAVPAETDRLIGYTQLQTNLPGGRHANVRTMRASVVNENGSNGRHIAPELANDADSWTQFAGWSPDGKTAVIHRGWESPENASWEEEHRTFRHTKEGWLHDSYLVDIATVKSTNVTAIDRVSFYNTIFFWPNDPETLGLTALVDGTSKLFRMDRDGRNKVQLNENSGQFAYGLNCSPDGSRIAYHENYQVYLADADGSHRIHVATGQPFNFSPAWSPDGKWVLFVAGEHYDCHPHVVRADGTGLKKLADRKGYRGVIEFLDVFDFHGGSSDTPVWSANGDSVIYTATVGSSVELHEVTLEGTVTQLTRTVPGSMHYHPQPSKDGRRLLYGSKRLGVRQLFVMNLSDRSEIQLTDLKTGHAAMWPHWQPVTSEGRH